MKFKSLITCTLFALCGCTAMAQQKNYPNLKPGDIAPDAISIEADFISYLINGTCIVQKGDLTAMVDLKGHFLFPWGKYQFGDLSTAKIPFTPLISIRDIQTGSCGFINSQGKVIVPMIYRSASPFDFHKIATVNDRNANNICIDEHGNKIANVAELRNFSLNERELYTRPQAQLFRFVGNHLYGYKDLSGRVAIAPQFEDIGEFTEGLAPVMKTDQFGVKKWGYINPSGKLVIPYTFQFKPGQFHNGLALVQPYTHTTNYSYAYIDKAGNIKFTVGDGRRMALPYPVGEMRHSADQSNGGFFINGYAIWNFGQGDFQLLDTLGKFHTFANIIKHPELAKDETGFMLDDYDDLGIRFHTTHRAFPYNTAGMMDYRGNIMFPPVFSYIMPDYYSQYGIAQCKLPDNPNGSPNSLFGIVNRQGVFVLTLKKPSVF